MPKVTIQLWNCVDCFQATARSFQASEQSLDGCSMVCKPLVLQVVSRMSFSPLVHSSCCRGEPPWFSYVRVHAHPTGSFSQPITCWYRSPGNVHLVVVSWIIMSLCVINGFMTFVYLSLSTQLRPILICRLNNPILPRSKPFTLR